MSIVGFRKKVIDEITNAQAPAGISREAEFEKFFLTPLILKIAAGFSDVRVYTHPWNSKARCKPDCESAHKNQIVAGCPKCWAASKQWASVFVFGTNNTFDIVARDRAGKTLVIEAKLVHNRNGRLPSGDIQRMLGQCALAKTKHDFVIGVCGFTGGPDFMWDSDTQRVRAWFKKIGIDLIFCSVD